MPPAQPTALAWLTGGQTIPQPPQLEPSFCGLTHTPRQQILPTAHFVPQLPQLLGSVDVLTQCPEQQVP